MVYGPEFMFHLVLKVVRIFLCMFSLGFLQWDLDFFGPISLAFLCVGVYLHMYTRLSLCVFLLCGLYDRMLVVCSVLLLFGYWVVFACP